MPETAIARLFIHGRSQAVRLPKEFRLRRGLTVVTANTSELSRVANLSWEDWTS